MVRHFRGPIPLESGFIVGDDNMISKKGKVVSKKSVFNAEKQYKKWNTCVKLAKRFLNIEGFVPCGGQTPAGKALYKQAKQFQA